MDTTDVQVVINETTVINDGIVFKSITKETTLYIRNTQRSKLCILNTYTVSRVTYTDEYRACILTSLGEFRYERYESVYVTLLTV